ncbi:rhodanese-like domain-containing protein [Natronolimnobius baerhuensis]|uniref:Rhodanese n=1 Tax=Natronolimnobius baerhuensis TaxID=253108 RepID=A0A202E5F6_9EURY|nr:rhodanese-like domain-containing protein [Natronolimnobius baerhuensis]OVE83475.1 rhodanese [Natronolimnobius baerhuensis]
MNRRHFLAAGTAVTAAGLAGCLGGDDGQGSSADGYGPDSEETPDERSIDTDSYETASYNGTEVPLAPLEDVEYWYLRQEARIVDTRLENSYEDLRITGAALSTAPNGLDNDPTADWPQEDRIVTYCVCPHTMAVQRAATLIDAGFEDVYALDDGLEPWVVNGYPIEGDEVDGQAAAQLPAYHVEGQSDPAYAGEYISVRTASGDKEEMSVVDPDGSYELTLHFANLVDDSVLEVDAPDYTRELTLEEATSDVITA